MPRNFDRRVEAVVPVEDPALHPRLDAVLDLCLNDNRGTWELRENGTYRQRHPGTDPERSAHIICQRDSWGRVPAADPVVVPNVAELNEQAAD